MQLDEFLQKNNIALPENLISLCQEGLKIMKKSIDPLHQEDHIFRILDSLNSLLKYNPQIIKVINFEILLPAICWHDTWKAKKIYRGKAIFLYHTVWDGFGSARLFKKHTRKMPLDKRLIRGIAYTIRQHASVRLLPSITMPAKILRELDLLDEWSEARIQAVEKAFLIPRKIGPRTIKLFKFYFDHYMVHAHKYAFRLPWIKEEFELRKRPYIHRVQKLADQYI